MDGIDTTLISGSVVTRSIGVFLPNASIGNCRLNLWGVRSIC